MHNKNITCVIPCAGGPQNPLFPGVHDPMIPINGKPTIDYILSNMKEKGVESFIVLLNKNDTQSYEYLQFKKKDFSLHVEKVESHSLGETLLYAEKYIQTDHLIIHLGDSLFQLPITFGDDTILVTDRNISDPSKWCFVDKNENFIENPSALQKDFRLVAGFYFLKQKKDFFSLLRNESFYGALGKYILAYKVIFQQIKEGYYDLGHLDEYYKSKIDFLRVRSFNSLEYDSFRGIITKKSTNSEKLKWEIHWFQNLPRELKIFTPRLVDYTLGKEVQYSLEFYGYTSLADIFLYSALPNSFLENIIEKLFSYISYVSKHYRNLEFSPQNISDMYFDKTFSRLGSMLENSVLKGIYEKEDIVINGKKYKNIKNILTENFLKDFIDSKICIKEDFTIIHGDLCFSNILFDTYNGLIKLIDPRGNFGEVGIWGDIKYDIAKMRHSIHGRYENIIADLFSLKYDLGENSFDFSYYNGDHFSELITFFDFQLKEHGYDVKTIQFIEGLLYLTMIPLHSDSLERQILMYITAVMLFDEVV